MWDLKSWDKTRSSVAKVKNRLRLNCHKSQLPLTFFYYYYSVAKKIQKTFVNFKKIQSLYYLFIFELRDKKFKITILVFFLWIVKCKFEILRKKFRIAWCNLELCGKLRNYILQFFISILRIYIKLIIATKLAILRKKSEIVNLHLTSLYLTNKSFYFNCEFES